MSTIQHLLEKQRKEFERLSITVYPEKCLEDKETIEKMKFLLPIAWDLFKPDLKVFLSTIQQEILQAVKEKVIEMRCSTTITDYILPYNQALSDLSSWLEGDKNN